MKIDGTWHITVQTSDGNVHNRLVAVSDGLGFTGRLTGPSDETQPIYDGRIDGNAVRWAASLTWPAAMTVAFRATIDGDRMTGNVQAGSFPEAPFTASREAQS